MKKKFISFIVIGKNEENFLPISLESIVGSYSKDISEIIYVDNDSCDSSPAIARSFGFEVFSFKGGKPSHLRNYGARKSKGNILCFLDSDVVISRPWVENLLMHIEKGAACACAPEKWYGENPTWVERIQIERKGLGNRNIRSVKWCQSGAFMIRRDVFFEVGGFDEKLETSEDADLGYRISKKYEIVKDGTIFFEHLRTAKNLKQYFNQQIWHGSGSYRSFFHKGISKSEILSFFVPIIFIALALFSMISPFLGLLYFLLSVSTMFCIVLLMVARDRRSIKALNEFLMVFVICFIFLVARGLAVFLQGKRIADQR